MSEDEVLTLDGKSEGRAATQRRPGRPRYEDGEGPESTRQKLLDAAIHLFARNGYDGVSTGDIAKRAKMTQSMVHYHFGSKLKIWEAANHAVMRRRGKMFLQDQDALKDLPPIERLSALTRKLIMANAKDQDFVQMALREGSVPGPRLDWLVENYYAAGYKIFDDAIAAAIEEKSIENFKVPEVTNVITATSLLFGLQAIVKEIYNIDFADDDVVESFANTLVHILFNGLLAKGANPGGTVCQQSPADKVPGTDTKSGNAGTT